MCGDCGNVYERDEDEDWLKCKGCKQWWHRECLDLSEGVYEDRYFVFNTCPKCESRDANKESADESEDQQHSGEQDCDDDSDKQDSGDDSDEQDSDEDDTDEQDSEEGDSDED